MEEIEEIVAYTGGGRERRETRGGNHRLREAGQDLIGLGGVQWSPPHQGGRENVPFSL